MAAITSRRRARAERGSESTNVLEGRGIGKLIAPLALRAARKDAPDVGNRIKRAVESS